ncbi:right-handed parallel beta-helix repeat-containing protein [Planctomicrobium sp. SH664]|uniref:right-handed parallel beta-helix repeat-containing protein n=1 Tax=Planctomicrobium sp. SH664 TaxID=3448125 RepID=UPI003F5B6E19
MHWTRRVSLLALFLLPWTMAEIASGQDPSVGSVILSPTDPGVIYEDSFSGSMAFSNDGGTYLLFDKMIGNGVGFSTGWSRFGLRSALWEGTDSQLFGETHMMVTDDSRIGFNVGGGYRWLDSGAGLWGVNGWYDNYESNTGFRYQQIGIGGEYLSPGFDVRTNFYIPTGNRENFVGIDDPGNIPVYMGNTFGTNGIGFFERAYYGWDAEAGVGVPGTDWLRAYVGPYVVAYNSQETVGVRARAEARFTYGTAVNFMVTNDDKFGTNLNLNVELRFSGNALATRFGMDYTGYGRRYDQVRRNWPVQTHVDRDGIFVPYINPRTGNDYVLTWVDNTAGPGGDGSFENPFQSLPGSAPSSDLVLVRAGVGDTTGTIQLVDYQQLLGEGQTHIVNTTRGPIALPEDGFSSVGPAPVLVGSGGAIPVVTLADHNVVRSFEINAMNGIAGTDVQDFRLRDLTGTLTNGINITNASGLGVLQNIDFNVNAGGTGISVANTSADPLLLWARDVRTDGGNFGTSLRAMGGDVALDVARLETTGATVAGLRLQVNNADMSGVLSEVNSSDNAGTGVDYMANNATGEIDFDLLNASNNGIDGLRAVADGGSNVSLDITNSTLVGNLDDNLETNAHNSSVLNLFVDPTDLSMAGDNGFEFRVTSGATLNAVFRDVTIDGSADDAVNGAVDTAGMASLTFDNVTGNDSGEDGIDIVTSTSGQLQANISNSSFDNNANRNIALVAQSSSQQVLNFNNVTADGPAAVDNVVMRGTGGQITSFWNGGSISGSSGNGVRAHASGASSFVSMDFDSVLVEGNTNNGFELSSTGTADVALRLNGSSVGNNGQNGIGATVDTAGSYVLVQLADTSVDGNGNHGVTANVTAGAFGLNGTAGGNSISSNIGSGVEITASGADSVAFMNLNDTVIDNNGAYGVMLDADDSAVALAQLSNGSASGNAFSGISTLSDNATVQIQLTDMTMDNNGSNGLDFTALNGGTMQVLGNGGTASGNAGSGIAGYATGAGSVASASFSDVVADNNTFDGFEFAVDNGGEMTAEILSTGLSSASNNDLNGISLTVNDAGSVGALIMTGNTTASNNGGNGLVAIANNADSMAVQAAGNFDRNAVNGVRIESFSTLQTAAAFNGDGTSSADGNAAAGVQVNVFGGSIAPINVTTLTQNVLVNGLDIHDLSASNNATAGVSVNLFAVTSSDLNVSFVAADGNGTNGIELTSTISSLTDLTVVNNSASDNVGDGILVNSTLSAQTGTTISGNTLDSNGTAGLQFRDIAGFNADTTVTGNTITGNGTDGILLDLQATTVSNLQIADNTDISGNGANGINFLISSSDIIGSAVSGNSISGHAAGDGIRIVNPTGVGTPLQIDFDNNSITGNSGGAGVRIELAGTTELQSNFTDNIISTSGLDGVLVTLKDASVLDVADFSRNTLESNLGMGVHITAEDASRLNFQAGASSGGTDRNTFTGNTDAGIGISLIEDSQASVTVTHTDISGTVNGTNTTFNGEGLHIRTTDNAVLTGLQIGDAAEVNTTFNGNESHGMQILANLSSSALNPTIQNVQANGNQGDGLNFRRTGNALVGTVNILDSEFSNNTNDGLNLTSSVGNLTDTYIVDNNVISQNGNRGIALTAEYDADVVATISNNTITFNGNEGIELMETIVVPADSRSLTVDILQNTISNNGGSGIYVAGLHDLTIDSNILDANGLDGIWIVSAALNPADPTVINNNQITNNGIHGIDLSAGNLTASITNNDINDNASEGIISFAGADTVISNNNVLNNGGDGVALNGGSHTINNNLIQENAGDGLQLISSEGLDLTVVADNNQIRVNEGRGINLLVSGDTLAQVSFNNGLVQGNNLEGVYVVNTASTTQSVDAPATDPLNADGSIFANPQLVFGFDSNTVINNGLGSGFDGSGLVIRVGTSGASTAANAYESAGQFVSNGLGFTAANLTGAGGVLASVTNNNILGHPGADVLFESFVSTVTPDTTGGTWDLVDYDPTGYQQDPVARFDLNFVGNTGDDVDVTRFGAFFENDESVFKSRTDAQDPAGPFTSGTRGRNAQRLAGRTGIFAPPLVNTVGAGGNSSDFQYSGVGVSTFRVSAPSNTAGFGSGDNFGSTVPLGAGIGELPFSWGVIP